MITSFVFLILILSLTKKDFFGIGCSLKIQYFIILFNGYYITYSYNILRNNKSQQLLTKKIHYAIVITKDTQYTGKENIIMTEEDKNLLERINEYADRVLKDFDPQKTRVSFQLEKLKPIMEEIAKEKNMTVEEIFIKYMDLASQVTVSRETKFQNTIGNMTKYGDVHDAF